MTSAFQFETIPLNPQMDVQMEEQEMQFERGLPKRGGTPRGGVPRGGVPRGRAARTAKQGGGKSTSPQRIFVKPRIVTGGPYLYPSFPSFPSLPSFPSYDDAMNSNGPEDDGTQDNTMHNAVCQCPQCQFANADEFEFSPFSATTSEYATGMSEAEEMALAMELLSLSSEAELDQFLGKMFKRVWKGIKKVAAPLGRVLKSVAKTALPLIGGALGSFIPIPGVGTALGSALGGAVSKALEMEYGEMEEGEQELEMARIFICFANDAIQQAANAPAHQPPQFVVQRALNSALLRQLPRQLGSERGSAPPVVGPSGRWMRRNGRIEIIL
jgi:hypothetical protein